MEELLKELQQLVTQIALFTPRGIVGLLIFLFFWAAGVFIKIIISRIGEMVVPTNKEVFNLMGKLAKGTLILLGLIMALGKMGINITALVAGLGLTGFALGFALKDVLSNALAGLLIFIYRPFQPNDRISVTGFEGIVIEIDLRYTTLLAEGKKILIPNSTLFINAIHVFDTQK
ncbi:MAG TPA: mechanosensitive ion channel domain-containing protein [Nitrospinota bacterium]|nr:mechanosensitive ion channel domain-containing protein [Nitrospinota bacterium]